MRSAVSGLVLHTISHKKRDRTQRCPSCISRKQRCWVVFILWFSFFFGHNLRTRMNSVGGHYSVSTFQHRVTEYPEECNLLRYVSSGCGNDGKACNTTYVNICTSSAEKWQQIAECSCLQCHIVFKCDSFRSEGRTSHLTFQFWIFGAQTSTEAGLSTSTSAFPKSESLHRCSMLIPVAQLQYNSETKRFLA